MRFGWLTLSLSPSPEEDADRIDQQIEQVRFAERLGFGDVWLTEHYFTGESVYNDALLFASAIAMRTERIRIGLLLQTRAHMMHVRAAYNPADFTIDPAMLNPWADPVVGEDEAVKYVLATGSLYGSPARVRDQVAEQRDAGVQHLLCQTGFGDMSHDENLASMRRFGEEVMPAFQT